MKIQKFILLLVALAWMSVPAVYAQAKGKSLKELVAEEKAQKEKEKQEKAEREAAEKAREESRKARTESRQSRDEGVAQSPEEAADFVTETDSALWAPTQVKQLGAQNFGELTQPQSSMDLRDPDNITTVVEYQPETGTYVIRTKMGDTDITTPYMLTQDEYNHYAERQMMHQYWQQKIGEVVILVLRQHIRCGDVRVPHLRPD